MQIWMVLARLRDGRKMIPGCLRDLLCSVRFLSASIRVHLRLICFGVPLRGKMESQGSGSNGGRANNSARPGARSGSPPLATAA